ncbi:hypothetical protein AVEN_263678-1 [Araneus ventricosus]|uniref:SOCS box domain-containing protein n=1 Tax=Araneus ventricosus TaxID=182803 RepID=A0A4Y2AS21_ARAVE|nr:hypothetical protein AVEN_263678-1 [Araneus ventricosus]
MDQQTQSLNLRTLFMILDYPFNFTPLQERRIDYERFMNRIKAGQGNARYKPGLSCCLLIELLSKFCPDLSTNHVIDFLNREFVELEEKSKLIYYISGRSKVLDIILSHCQKVKLDFWGVWNNSVVSQASFNILTAAILFENDRSVQVLLKYGFPYAVTENTFFSLCDRFLRLTYDGVNIATRNVERNIIYYPRRRRLQLALILFHLFTRSAQLSSKVVRCLRLMWSAIEDPFFSDQELYDILSPVMEENFQVRFKQLCSDCQVRGDLTRETGPRDLKHLARCAVRKSLAKKFLLPDGIEELPLPTTVKEYLQLHPWIKEY